MKNAETVLSENPQLVNSILTCDGIGKERKREELLKLIAISIQTGKENEFWAKKEYELDCVN